MAGMVVDEMGLVVFVVGRAAAWQVREEEAMLLALLSRVEQEQLDEGVFELLLVWKFVEVLVADGFGGMEHAVSKARMSVPDRVRLTLPSQFPPP